MKIISVIGYSDSGKTTVIERLTAKLKMVGYRVGTVKSIDCEFEISPLGKDTQRHMSAGADVVYARSWGETHITLNQTMNITEIYQSCKVDYLLLEGVRDAHVPTILAAGRIEDIEEQLNVSVFLITGKIAESIREYKGIKVINAIINTDEIINLLKTEILGEQSY